MSNEEFERGKRALEAYFDEIGCETHFFKIGWYNDVVKDVFKLSYNYDTLACLVISTPHMFEKAFVPFVKNQCGSMSDKFDKDPLDECLSYHFNQAKLLFPDIQVDVLKDYELWPSRRPKVLVQTAAHVSGAAYYYQDTDIAMLHEDDCPVRCTKTDENFSKRTDCICKPPWPGRKKMFGVCIHPVYGGWFALRGVMLFNGIKPPYLAQRQPEDVVSSREMRIELLKRFNGNWKDGTYRDIIHSKEKYSNLQQRYFNTLPKNRHHILNEIVST